MVFILYRLRRVVFRLARRRALLLLIVFLALWLLGALLFYTAEKPGVDFATSLYWALITMATVGYGDVVPTTGMGRLVAGITAVFGIATYTLLISTLADYFLEATVKAAMGLGVLKGKRILVIGEGAVCEEAVTELVANGLGEETGWFRESQPRGEPPVDFIVGELDERSLQRAGIGEARHIIICYEDDSKNIHATALARRLNPTATITVLAKDKIARQILTQLGAQNVVPIAVLGRLLASSAFEPAVAAFIADATSAKEGIDLVEREAPGKTITQVEEETGYKALAIVTKEGTVKPAKPGETLAKGEKVILLRPADQENNK